MGTAGVAIYPFPATKSSVSAKPAERLDFRHFPSKKLSILENPKKSAE
jgi:hypothetical protein